MADLPCQANGYLTDKIAPPRNFLVLEGESAEKH
jgi:hypothetical protein